MKCPRIHELPPPPAGKTGWPWTAESRVAPPEPPGGGAWPRITIVVPNYNYGRFLEDALRSILLQGYPDLELIVQDGGSSDDSVDVIRKYEPWLTFWTTGKDGGQFAAINAGMARATGAVLAYLNSDDRYHPGAFEVVGGVCAQFPEVEWLTTGFPSHWSEDGRLASMAFTPGYTRAWFCRGWHMSRVAKGHRYKNWIQQESTFWRRTLWDRAGGSVDASLHAAGDYALWARFWRHANLATVAMPLGGYRRHSAQKMADQGLLKEYEAVIAQCRTDTFQHPLLIKLAERWHGMHGFGPSRVASPMLRVSFDDATSRWVLKTVWRV